MRVRDARPEDAPAIAGLSAELGAVLRAAGNPVGAALGETELQRDAFGPDRAISLLVAEMDGAAVGYLLHHPAYDPDLGGRVTSVVDLCVSAAFRRRGVGRALLEAALDRCRRAGGHALVWWVRAANRDAVAFYERIGASAHTTLAMHLPVRRAPLDPW